MTPSQSVTRLVDSKSFPCMAARAALAKQQITEFEAGALDDGTHDRKILESLNVFVEGYRSKPELYQSFVVLFPESSFVDEASFEKALWARLQALHELDSVSHEWSKGVSADPQSNDFGFSLCGEAFFLIGMHPASSRAARRSSVPSIVFNLHDQFERLRQSGKYEPMQRAIRERDQRYSGSVNPMVADFGTASEAKQYSGRAVGKEWKCPFHAKR